jgi:hypothetical protein
MRSLGSAMREDSSRKLDITLLIIECIFSFGVGLPDSDA